MTSLKKQQEAGIILFWCIVMAAVLIVACSLCHAAGTGKQRDYSTPEVCHSIFMAEGGYKAKHYYGIMIHYASITEAQEICFRTVRNSRAKWIKAGKPCDFILWLSRSYAPIGANNDLKGLNKNWVRNVHWFINNKNK